MAEPYPCLVIDEVSDKQALREAWSVLGWAFDPPLWEQMEDYDSYLTKVAERAVTLLIRVNGQLSGGVSFYANDVSNHRSYITQLMVVPSHQGQGIGSRLLKACEQYSLASSMTSIRLEVWKENNGAKRLYEHAGYVVCGETERCFLMEKTIGLSKSSES